jgi:signal peptidase II
MKRFFALRNIVLVGILICNMSCDQISKSIIRKSITAGETIVVSSHFKLLKVENTGAFLSWGNALPEIGRVLLLIILPLVSLAFGFFYMITSTSWTKSGLIGLACIIGGGLGNLYDRMLLGSVTDFMHIKIGFFQTGIFNLADVSIMIGMSLVMLEFLFKAKRESKTESTKVG